VQVAAVVVTFLGLLLIVFIVSLLRYLLRRTHSSFDCYVRPSGTDHENVTFNLIPRDDVVRENLGEMACHIRRPSGTVVDLSDPDPRLHRESGGRGAQVRIDGWEEGEYSVIWYGSRKGHRYEIARGKHLVP
ncbi:MAG: hypothetical protein ACLP9C_11645, partial [Acidimicrobiales bacterium]